MRPQVIQVGPLIAATATKVGLTQKAAISGTNYLVLNGAAGSFVVNSVCASQTPGGAVALTLNGTLANSATGTTVVNLPVGSRIYITGGSDESGKTFAVVGLQYVRSAPGGAVLVTETMTGPNASTVSSINTYDKILSITSSAGTTGAITVGHYGKATLDTPRRILYTPAGADSGITLTFTGTDYAGTIISETLAGVDNASTTYTVLDYATITSISTSGAIASTATIGTNGIASSPWVTFDPFSGTAPTAIQATVSGTVNYTIQQTLDDPNSTSNSVARSSMTWVSHPDSAVVAATSTAQANYAYAPAYSRILLNSYTNPGFVKATYIQAFQG